MTFANACHTNSTSVLESCCSSASGVIVNEVCGLNSTSVYLGCVAANAPTSVTYCTPVSKSAAGKKSIGIMAFIISTLAFLAVANAQSAESLIAEANSVLGVEDVCDGSFDHICNVTILDYFPAEYANLKAPAITRDLTRANLTVFSDRFYISRVVNPEAVAALTSDSERKRDCVQTGYYLDEYLNFQGGTWDDAWVPHCDDIAWSHAYIGSCSSISKSTSYSVSLTVGWKKIISAKMGASCDSASTNSKCYGALSSCGCFRLWTSNRMTWNSGTMYHNYVQNTGCGLQGSKSLLDRTDNIHTDAGETDSNGLLNVTPGGSPCSDGPSYCSRQDAGWQC